MESQLRRSSSWRRSNISSIEVVICSCILRSHVLFWLGFRTPSGVVCVLDCNCFFLFITQILDAVQSGWGLLDNYLYFGSVSHMLGTEVCIATMISARSIGYTGSNSWCWWTPYQYHTGTWWPYIKLRTYIKPLLRTYIKLRKPLLRTYITSWPLLYFYHA
jgi:hypothetical protein